MTLTFEDLSPGPFGTFGPRRVSRIWESRAWRGNRKSRLPNRFLVQSYPRVRGTIFLLTHFEHVGAMMRPVRARSGKVGTGSLSQQTQKRVCAEIARKQFGGDDDGGSQRLETGGLHLRNRDGCGDVDGRDGGEGLCRRRL